MPPIAGEDRNPEAILWRPRPSPGSATRPGRVLTATRPQALTRFVSIYCVPSSTGCVSDAFVDWVAFEGWIFLLIGGCVPHAFSDWVDFVGWILVEGIGWADSDDYLPRRARTGVAKHRSQR